MRAWKTRLVAPRYGQRYFMAIQRLNSKTNKNRCDSLMSCLSSFI